MLNMNRVTLLGHAGRDPEIRTIKSGDKTATFSLATTDKWRRKDGGTGGEFNTRPRKTLGWRTPAEALDQCLQASQTERVATTG